MKCTRCPATTGDTKWEKIKAHDAGWFQQRNGDVFCPEHVPEWVERWRERVRERIDV